MHCSLPCLTVLLIICSATPHELDVERFTAHNTSCSNETFVRGYGQKVRFTHLNIFFKYGPIPASFSFIFVLFTPRFNYKLKKRRLCAWDSNPELQDGKRRQNYGAMVVAPKL